MDNTPINFVTTTASAAMLAQVFTSLFKLAVPSAKPPGIVAVAVAGGVVAALLFAMQQGVVWTGSNTATVVISGFLAAGTAAGIRGIDQRADAGRPETINDLASQSKENYGNGS